MDIIGSIDDKIECNNSIILVIENMIKHIYKKITTNGKIPIKLVNLVSKSKIQFDYLKEQKTLDLSNINSNSINLSSYSSSNDFKTNLYTIRKGTLYYGSIRPYLHKSGICPFDGAVAGTVHTFIVDENNKLLVLGILTNDSLHDFAVANSRGTKMPVINYDDLINYEIYVNNDYQIILDKNKYLIDKLIDLMNQNFKLKEYKNLILPLLLNEQVL